MLFEPSTGTRSHPAVTLFDAITEKSITEANYFRKLGAIYNARNPHAAIEELAENSSET